MLKGVIGALQATDEPYIHLHEAYTTYKAACEANGTEAEERSVIRSHLKNLSMDGYILSRTADGEQFFGISGHLDRIAEAVEAALKQALQNYS